MNNMIGYDLVQNPAAQQLPYLHGATAAQLQDAARQRHQELSQRSEKMAAELDGIRKEMSTLATMFPKSEPPHGPR